MHLGHTIILIALEDVKLDKRFQSESLFIMKGNFDHFLKVSIFLLINGETLFFIFFF